MQNVEVNRKTVFESESKMEMEMEMGMIRKFEVKFLYTLCMCKWYKNKKARGDNIDDRNTYKLSKISRHSYTQREKKK